MLKNYLKLKLKVFINKCKNPFEIRFPNLRHLEYFRYSDVHNEIWEILEDLEIKQLEYKFMHLVDKINDRINIKYYN